MAQASVEKRLQIPFEDDNKESNSAKRMKKEPGSVTGKSVVVLRHSDVTRGMSSVLMPNTIEMAQLKKPGKGQFKTNIQISSKMTEMDIERTLIENFPILRHQRFCCAAAVDNRTRLDFHGEPRIWDGHSIKRKIKGNSALYILTEEENQQQNENYPRESEQSPLKQSHDTATKELSAQSKSDTTPVEMHTRLSIDHAAHPGSEKQLVPGNPLKQLTSYPTAVSGPAPTTGEKISGNLQSTEGQFMRHEIMDKFPPTQGFVLVASQRGMLPSVHHASISTIHSVTNARDVVTMATSSLPQPLPMGAIMVPGGGIAVAQPGVIANKAVSTASIVGHPGPIGRSTAISTASDHQSLRKTVFHVAKGPGAWHAGLPIVPQMNMLVPQTLTPQLNSLNISSATTQQLQKPVIAAGKSTGIRDQDAQTEATETLQQAPPIMTLQERSRSFPVEYSNKITPLPHEGGRFKSPDQTRQSHDAKTSSSQIKEKGACANTADVDGHRHSSGVSSDYELLVSDQTDSGIETTDNAGEGVSQSREPYLDVAMGTQRRRENVVRSNEIDWARPGIDEGDGLSLLSGVALKIRSAVTEKKSIVDEICPKKSSIRGGGMFVLILNEHLPSDIDEGYRAYFGTSAPVVLTKVNQINLKGTVPAYQAPGLVTVKVVSSTGSYLGETLFEYIDEVQDIMRQLVRDKEMHSAFFHIWAQELAKETSKTEEPQPSQANPSFKTAGNQVSESGYEADDEASDDGDVPCSKVTGWNPNSKIFSHDDVIEQTGYREDIERLRELLSGEFMYERFRNIRDREQADIQVNLLIFFPERFPNSQDLDNLTSYSFNGQESGASISELESSAFPSKSSDEVAGVAFDNSGSVRDNSEAPERANNQENMDIVDNQLNNVGFDENSSADRTRRANERNGDEEDWAGDPL